MSFNDLNLDARLLKSIEKLQFTTPTDIQREAIPVVMAGKDLMASAQTGTGKTAAFMLPALHRLLTVPAQPGRGPRILVLTPTRELAQQVTDAVTTFSKDTRLTMGVIVGGVSYFHQERLLARPCDILVATPGRLMDHMNRGRVDFSRLELLILDEADRMLDMGFVDDVEMIASKTPANRQTLLFSATLEGDIERVARKLLKEPVTVNVAGVKQKHASITQYVLAADDFRHKMALLDSLLRNTDVKQAVVFVATKSGCEEMAEKMQDNGHFAAALHGDMRQSVRNRVIERAHAGKLRILVATDVAARGLDVKGLTHVINFDLPMVAEDYVHRIGRTGRAGATGIAMSLIGPQDWFKLQRIERLTGQPVEEMTIEGLEPRSGRPQRRSGGGGGSGRPQRDGRAPQSRFGEKRREGSSFRDRNDAPRADSGRSEGGRGEFARRASGSDTAPRSEYPRRAAGGDTRTEFRGERRPRRDDR